MDLDRFVDEVRSLGFPAEPVLDFLRLLYVAGGEMPHERWVRASSRTERLLEVEV